MSAPLTAPVAMSAERIVPLTMCVDFTEFFFSDETAATAHEPALTENSSASAPRMRPASPRLRSEMARGMVTDPLRGKDCELPVWPLDLTQYVS